MIGSKKMKNKIVLKGNKIVSAVVNVKFFKDEEYNDIVARCPALRITTYGKNLEHAKKMFKEAFELWIETTNEDCDAKEILKNLNWHFEKSEATAETKREINKMPFIVSDSLILNTNIPAWAN
jgi:predicted RNase H-like HicB family nuclease